MRSEKSDQQLTVETDLLTWMAVQGMLELALRHPQNIGPSRARVEIFSSALLERLHTEGILTDVGFSKALQDQETARKHRGG